MKIFVITICNKNDNYLNDIIKKYSDLIDNFYKITFIDINFKQKKVKKNLYEKEYKKAVSLIKPQSYVVASPDPDHDARAAAFCASIALWNSVTSTVRPCPRIMSCVRSRGKPYVS